jgi:8-oxo-dGTP pyrophosphatase MutT (NUDIX family)
MAIERWKLIERKDVSPSKWYPLFVDKVELPNGTVIDDYYVSELGDVAMVIAITPENEIVFARQYKHGVREILLELPAGRIGGKSPEEAAHEELREETGIIAEKLIKVGQVSVAPSKDSTYTHVFVVPNARIEQEQDLDATENIELVKIPIEKIDEKIASGEIRVADTIAALTLARLNKTELFQ